MQSPPSIRLFPLYLWNLLTADLELTRSLTLTADLEHLLTSSLADVCEYRLLKE